MNIYWFIGINQFLLGTISWFLFSVSWFLILHWFLSLFSQTFYQHRYVTHRQFEMLPFWQKFFYGFAYVSEGSSFLDPRVYAVLHRVHHEHSDTELDPHPPNFFKDVFTFTWHTKKRFSDYAHSRVKVDPKFLENLPDFPKLFSFWADSWASRLIWGASYLAMYYFVIDGPWWTYLFLPIHFLMGPIQGSIVNWCGHKYGYRNFDTPDKSKNTPGLAIPMLAEIFQNNHHKDPGNPNFGVKWHELDIVYWLAIRPMNFMHIIKIHPKYA